MGRPAKATINLDAIKKNYRLSKSLRKNSKSVAVIKANAYGHGSVEVANTLNDDADAFGVSCIEEAIELIDAGINTPILLLEGFFDQDELDYISKNNIWTVIHNSEQIEALKRANLSHPCKVWLKADIGMNRLGFPLKNLEQAHCTLTTLKNVSDIVLIGHFSSADNLDSRMTLDQLKKFITHTENINSPLSLANSAGILAWPNSELDWIRPGLMLYGASPFEKEMPGIQLTPVMTLTSEIIAIRNLNPGERVGYGGIWSASSPCRIGVVALGYGDGYPRGAVSGTPVFIQGRRSSIVGRVSMDMVMVDLSNHQNTYIGSEVEFWGEHISINEVSSCCNTVPYTLLTGLMPRVNKKYISTNKNT